jgi:hypothetical protein
MKIELCLQDRPKLDEVPAIDAKFVEGTRCVGVGGKTKQRLQLGNGQGWHVQHFSRVEVDPKWGVLRFCSLV